MSDLIFLLGLEWKKFRKYNVFRVLSISYLLALPLFYLIAKQLPDLPPPLLANDQFFQFPTIWPYFGYLGNWLAFFFLGFLGVLIVTMEHSHRTLRQNIITGLSRTQFFLAKLSFTTLIAILATAYFAFIGFLYGFLHTQITSMDLVFSQTAIIGRYFLMCFSYMMFGLFLGILVRRTGIAVLLYFSYILFIERIMRWLIHMNIAQHKSMHFYPMNATSDLVPVPLGREADNFISEKGFSLFLSPTEAVITVIIYTLIFIFLSYRLIKKRDL